MQWLLRKKIKNVFLLKILLNFISVGKCLSINVRKVFATFMATLILTGVEPGNFPLSCFVVFIVFVSRYHIKL